MGGGESIIRSSTFSVTRDRGVRLSPSTACVVEALERSSQASFRVLTATPFGQSSPKCLIISRIAEQGSGLTVPGYSWCRIAHPCIPFVHHLVNGLRLVGSSGLRTLNFCFID